jgi:fructokinase
MSDPTPLLGGIELGGTKCVCVIGTGPNDIRAQTTVPTGADPALTLGRLDEFLRDWQKEH